MRIKCKFLCITLFSLIVMFTFSNRSHAQTSVPGMSGSLGTITTCDDVRVITPDGITGNSAGFTGGPAGSFSGGGSTFTHNPSSHSTSRDCAGADLAGLIPYGSPDDIEWLDFDYEDDPDLTEEENKERRLAMYGLSTRDATRGRAAKNNPLFMNQHGICRKIDNTTASSSLEPVFVGVRDAEEWRTVHGVPAGGDPNSGHTTVSGRADLPAMIPCCSPTRVTICGSTIKTQYAGQGDNVEVYTGGGYATLRCDSNNRWVTTSAMGICGGGGGGGGGTGGFSNPNNGGTISADQMSSMSPAAQAGLAAQGYAPSSSVSTNATGAADAAAAAAAAEAAAEAEAEAAAAAAAAAEAAAAAAAAEAEAAAEDDGDDDAPI